MSNTLSLVRRNEGTPSSEPSITLKEPLGSEVRYLRVREKEREREREREITNTKMGRAPCCDKANVKKGPWSPEEDAKLKEYIDKYGTGGNWIALPQKAGKSFLFLFLLVYLFFV